VTQIVDLTDYRATPTQWAFLQDHRSRIKAMIGGLGSGKTRALAEACVDLYLMNRGTGVDGMLVSPTHKMLVRLLKPAFERAMPRELIDREIKGEFRYKMRDGTSVWYGSADTPASLEGTNLGWFGGDEVRYWQRRAHENMAARLRDQRARLLQGAYATTPAQGWLSDEFDSGRADRATYRCSTVENAANLAPGYIEDLRATYSPRLAKSLIDGLFTIIEGQVYEEWDEARHLVDVEPKAARRTCLWWDFGARRSAVVIAQVLGEPMRLTDGRMLPARSVVAIDQVIVDDVSTERLIPMVMARLGRKLEEGVWSGGLDVHAVYCDPAGNQRGQAVQTPSVALLRAAFGNVVRYYTDVGATYIPNGVARVSGALSPVDGSMPRLYVRRQLAKPDDRAAKERGIVKMFAGLRYPDKHSGQSVDHPVKDGVLDHVGDAVRYGLTGHTRDDWAVSTPRTGLSLAYDAADEG